jgi:hypothetical protein
MRVGRLLEPPAVIHWIDVTQCQQTIVRTPLLVRMDGNDHVYKIKKRRDKVQPLIPCNVQIRAPKTGSIDDG